MGLRSKKAAPPADDFGFQEDPDDFGFQEDKPVDLMKKFNEAGYKTAAPDFFRDGLYAATGFADKASLENLRYNDKFKQELAAGERDSPRSTMVGKGLGLAGVTAASMMSPVNPYVAAGIQGAMSKPTTEGGAGDDLAARGIQAVTAPIVAKGLNVVGGGLKKGGDYLMQKAVGAKEYIPGMGTRLADEGLFGTRGMMKDQIQVHPDAAADRGMIGRVMDKLGMTNKLPAREAVLDKAVARVQGDVPPARVEAAIRGEAAPYIPQPKSGYGPLPVPSGNQPFVDLSTARAQEALARGSLSPEEAVAVSRAVAKPAYNKAGDPLDAFKHKVSQAEAISLKDGVKELGDAQGIPEVRSALASEQALIHARKSMERQEPMAENVRRFLYRSMFGGAGYSVGGPAGLVAGYGASTPLGLSLSGQAMTKGGQSIPYLTPMALDAVVRKLPKESKK